MRRRKFKKYKYHNLVYTFQKLPCHSLGNIMHNKSFKHSSCCKHSSLENHKNNTVKTKIPFKTSMTSGVALAHTQFMNSRNWRITHTIQIFQSLNQNHSALFSKIHPVSHILRYFSNSKFVANFRCISYTPTNLHL